MGWGAGNSMLLLPQQRDRTRRAGVEVIQLHGALWGAYVSTSELGPWRGCSSPPTGQLPTMRGGSGVMRS